MADVDFALAQVRDRDLVIESLRETNRMLDLARRDQKTRAEAAEAKLNAHAIEISQHKGDLRRAEAKLAEVENDRTDQVRRKRATQARLTEVEKALDSTTRQLHEVEKERDALVRAQYKANLRAASMDRARELAEKASDENTEYHTMPEIARLLSGDEEPKTAWPDPDDEPMKATTKGDT